MLPDIISEFQSAFVSGRQISDGVLVANEVVKWAELNKKRLLLFKIDFTKAYDCLNWEFLDSILQQMQFGVKWQTWMRTCLYSASVSILVNGSPTIAFTTERGLHQGDPLSPFLFIITVEVINAMMKEAIGKSVYKPFKVGNRDMEISHLQFADDALFFGDWSTGNASALLHLLKNFKAALGYKLIWQRVGLLRLAYLSRRFKDWLKNSTVMLSPYLFSTWAYLLVQV